MATYNNFSDVADKAEFLEFIKTEFGIDDVAKISPIEQQAMFYKFKSHEGDLSDADIAFLKEIDNANKPEDMEALAKAQYDKSLSGLTADEKIFVSVKAYEAADKGVSVDEMVAELAKKPAQKETKGKQKQKAKTKQDEPQVTQQNDDTEYHRDLLYRDFLDLSAIKYLEEDATRARREDMDAFVAKKDSFIKSHPEMETEVNNQLDDFVKTEGNEIMWKGEPYRIQDEFKKYYMERFHPEKKSEKEQKNKETKVATQEAVEAGSAQVIVAFRSREELFDAFHKLGAEIEVSGIGTAKQQVKVSDIHDFVARKEGYFETHAAERDEINGQIDDFLKQDYVMAEGYGWTYAPSDEFREIYKKVSADYAAANTGKGGKGGKDNGGKGQKPELQTIVIGGNGGNDNGGKGGKGQKPELQTVMVGGNGGNDNGGAQIPPQQQYEIIKEDIRVRSHDNYDNTTLLYATELELLHDRKLVADDDFTTARDTLLKAIRERDLSAGLPEGQIPVQTVSPEDMTKARQLVDAGRDKIPQNKVASYKFELADRIVVKALEQDRRSETLLTPELTAVAIEGYTQTAKNKSLSDAEKQALNTKLRMTTSHGESLLYQLVDKRGYYFTDITNAADEYDGYMHLADVCEKKYDERMAAQNGGKKPNIKGYTSYDETRDLMKEYIKPYDELYHIPASKNATTELTKNPKNTAIKLTSRMVDATKIIDKLEFNEDTLGKEFLTAMQNFRFVEAYDKDGKSSKYEESIVLNADGKMEVVKGSRLDTALRFAANEGMIQDLGDFDKKITKESILEGAKDNTFKTLFAYANSEEVVRKGLRENPYKFTDPKYLEEFTRGLMSGEKTVDISLLANDLALKRQTNNMEVYGNRISGKVGAENAQYLKALLARQVQKIDGSSKDTKDNAAYLKNKATWRNLGTAALSGGISTAVAYAATKLSLGSSIGNALGLKGASTMVAGGLGRELIAGGGAAAIGAIGGAAVATLSFFAVKKIAAMTKHQKYGWKDVKKDLKSPTYLTALTAGALGGASVGFALSGCPLCAAGLGVASVGVAGSGRFIRSYKDMRLNGHGVAMATALGAVNAVATFAGAKLGYELGTSGVNMNETVTASAEQAKELYGEHGSNLEQSQSDGWNFESSDHQQPGYTLLEQETSEVGPYHNYNMQEHDWASMRNDGIRWSEYLNDGKGGLHVQPDYQNGTGGLNHDYALYDNAIKSLDEAAQQPGNEWMNTYENDEVKSNSAMLFYKLYQKAVLMHNDNVQLADGSGTVGDVYNVDADHTANGVFQKLLQGEKLDAQDVQVISKVEDNIGGEIHEGVNDMGKVPDIKGSTHPTDRVDSYTFGDKGYDEVTKNETADLYGKFTRVMDRVAGFGALLFALPRKVKDHLRPGAKADQRKIDETRRPIEPPVVIDNPPVEPPVVIDNPPVIHPKPEEHQLLIEEYWMIHGYNPAARVIKDKNGKPLKDEKGNVKTMEINPMAFDAGYKAYVQNVEKERVAAGGKPMLEFLQKRRAEMDKVIKDQTASYLGGHNARLNADILDPVGYKQVLKKQAELKAEGKSMSKDEVDKAILWPTPKELTDNFTEHRPTSKLCKIIRDSFWRKDNKVDIKNPKQRSTVEMDAKDAKSNIEIIGPNKKVFSFYDFIASAKDTLVRTTKETERDVTKAPRRRTLDEMGKMRRTKQSQH